MSNEIQALIDAAKRCVIAYHAEEEPGQYLFAAVQHLSECLEDLGYAEDQYWTRAAREALAEMEAAGEPPISWAQLKVRLGLSQE